MRGSPKMPLDARLCIFYILYTVNYPAPLHDLLISTANPVRAAGDCRPYHWTPHGPPFYILYIFYTVNYPDPLHDLHVLHGQYR